MNYEVKSIITSSTKEEPVGTLNVVIGVKVGVVDDTYGFIPFQGEYQLVKFTCPMTLTADQIKAEQIAQATAWVTAKYPNT